MTREQRKRERVKTAVMAVALVVMWFGLCTMLAKAWLDEPVTTGYEYMEQIGGEFDE
jgi:hypothetical protein